MVIDLVFDKMDGPFIWGRADCCTSACDVFAALHGVDPMARLRGRYDTKDAAAALIRSEGGWRRMFKKLAEESGLTLCQGHGAGRLGLVRIGSGYALAIGIEDGLWAGKIDGGTQTVGGAVLSCHN